MKLSYSSLLAFLLISATVAAPNKLEQREPSNAPINLDHALEEGEIKECGGNFYDDHQVYLSIQHAVNLQKVGETRGKAQYPHSFDKDDSKGNKLNFPDYCPADTNRMEYPLKVPTYDGGKSNTNTGEERVVYYWKQGDESYDGNPNVIYCGVMTHTGAPTGGFNLC
ncbi:MAG: hypothetical protein Q9201_004330 [Fulgogasparrea decipioides]